MDDDQIQEMFEEDYAGFHDVIVQVLDLPEIISMEECITVFKQLPLEIQCMAETWGLSETEFRNSAYVYIQEHRISI